MRWLARILLAAPLFLGIGYIFTAGAAQASSLDSNSISSSTVSNTTTPSPVTPQDVPSSPKEEGFDWTAFIVPLGGSVTGVLGGIALILKNVNDGKKIDVQSAEEKLKAERESNATALDSLRNQVGSLEEKLDKSIKKQEEMQTDFLNRKTHFTKQMVDIERRHRDQIQASHDLLLEEIRHRHTLEEILAAHGIEFPRAKPEHVEEVRKQSITTGDIPAV